MLKSNTVINFFFFFFFTLLATLLIPMQTYSQLISKGQMLTFNDSLKKYSEVNIKNNMNNGEGFVYAHFSNKDSLIKEFGPLESFIIEMKNYDSLYFVFRNITRSDALGMEAIVDFYKPVFPNREFKFDIKFVKEPDINDNETISFSHNEFIDLLAGDESYSGLLYTLKIEDIEDARKISVLTTNESDKFIDIMDMDSTTFEVQVRLKSFDDLKRNKGISSKGWNREVTLSPLGVILKDNSGTNHIKKTISFVFKKSKK